MNLTFATLFLAIFWAGSRPYDVLAFAEYNDCGGVVPVSAWYSTIISYQQSENFCVWTLLSEKNVTPVQMQILQNITDPDDGIVAYFWTNTGLTAFQLSHDNMSIAFGSPPLFLAFSSHGPNKNYSFSITFPAQERPPTLLQHEAYHLEKDEGNFVYPPKESGKDEYGNNERVSVVVHPYPRGLPPTQNKKVTLTLLGTELDHDFVHVYTLRSYLFPDPDLRGRFSGMGTFYFLTETYDPMVFVFTSDQKVTGKGFSIKQVNLRSKEL